MLGAGGGESRDGPNHRLARAFYARISGAGKQMSSISLRLSLFVGVHAGLLLGLFLLA